MAGPRRAQYVSLPLGPGVLSNTTGRGGHTRQNYMNWDRWKDATWVRWHKLLPEKQGGWQYQALSFPNAALNPIPGTPLLLLHFNGTNGQTTTVDSSVYANPVSINNGALSTSAPKFGSASFLTTGANLFGSYACAVPFGSNTPLDIFATPEWTIECQVLMTATGASMNFVDYGGSQTGAPTSDLVLFCGTDGTTFTVGAYDYAAFGTAVTISTSTVVNGGANTWHHVALVGHAGAVRLYLDGIAAGASGAWIPANYAGTGTKNVVFGSFSRHSGGDTPGQVDEARVSGFAVYTTNFTPPLAENTLGLPNTLGTPNPPNGFVVPVYLGLARDLHDWSSIDGQFWVAIGTHLKLYVVNQATLYDITPQRKTSNLTNALTTTNTSNVVTVTDVGHQAGTGDFVDITGASAVGGVTVAGSYPITVVDPSTYTIVAASSATSGASGGGNFSVGYEIGIGLPSNGELLGYGTGPYGIGTYGTPRPVGSGVPARLRTWSLDNYGQDLIASQSDGEIYIWQRNGGPNSRATLLTNAPQGVQRVIVDAQQHVIIALGCTDVTGAFNALLVRWCSFDNLTDWFPTDVNTAGDDIVTDGSRIITGLKTKGQNLVFTDKQLYRMVFVGAPDIYDLIPAGAVTIVGPNAAVDVDGVAYFMGYDNLYNYSGTLNLQACDVWETVFDPQFPTSLLKSQAEKVVCYTFEPKTEVTWLYPSIGGSGENDRYVTFNWEDGTWYSGAWNRTCAQGRAAAMGGYPYGVNGGYLYQHEIGTDAIEATGTRAIAFAMRSLDITVGGAKSEYTMGGSDARFAIGGSDSHLLVRSLLPDWKYFSGQMNLTLFTKDRPQDAKYVQSGPVTFDQTTGQIDIDAHGSQVVIQMDNYTVAGASAADPQALCLAQATSYSPAPLVLNGTLAGPVPIAISPVAALTVTQTSGVQDGILVTVTGTDLLGAPAVEVIHSVASTTVTGQVLFASVTSISSQHGSLSSPELDVKVGTAAGVAASLNCAWRMGILQGLAVPYAKR